MMREDVLTKLRAMAPELKELGFSKLYLFGSVARNALKSRDVDLLYEGDPKNDPDFFEVGRVQDRLEGLLGRPVDLVDRPCLHPRIRGRVEAEMIEVY